MYEGAPNPGKLQSVPFYKRPRPMPLVLIHDGGGTTFSYFLLGNMNRDVWAIHSPYYADGALCEGGIDAMARQYIDMLQDNGIKGDVLLGGWSLGGMLSVTMARMLADDPEAGINVKGILMIDTPHHIARKTLKGKYPKARLSHLPDLVLKSFDNCDIMLQDWDLPSWDAPVRDGKTLSASVGDKNLEIPPGKLLYKPLKGEWQHVDVEAYQNGDERPNPVIPPPAVMIRCVQHVATMGDAEGPAMIDRHREKTLLGWEGQYPDFIKATIDYDADHYSIFDKANMNKMDGLTDELNKGLAILDSLQ